MPSSIRCALISSACLSLALPLSTLAADDVFSGPSGAAISGNVLANDGASGGATLTFEPRNGTVEFAADGNFTYTPREGFEGVDGFTYTTSVSGREVPSLVRLFSGRFQIVSVADTAQALATPSAANRTSLTLQSREGGNPGTLWTLTSDGDIVEFRTELSGERDAVIETWQPGGQGRKATIYRRNNLPWQDFRIEGSAENGDVIRSDYREFNIQVSEGSVVSGESVAGRDDEWLFAGATQVLPPIATDDVFAGEAGEVISGRVLTNDIANSGDFASFLVSGPANGEFIGINQSIYGGLAPFGAFDYQPDEGFEGTDSFSYLVLGSSPGAPSRIATVTLEVGDTTPAPQPAEARSDFYATAVDTTFEGSVRVGDARGQRYELVEAPTYGELVGIYQDLYGGVAPFGLFEYQPPTGFQGLDAFAYRALNDDGDSEVRTVFISVGEVEIASLTGDRRNRLALTAAGDRNRSNVSLAVEDGSDLQGFTITETGEFTGLYTLALDRTVLETWQPNAAGTDATVYTPNGRPWQNFRVEVDEATGGFVIVSDYTDRVLSAEAQTDGADVGTSERDSAADSQTWIISGVGQTAQAIGRDDSYTVASGDILSGRVLSNDDSSEFDLGAQLVTRPENGEFIGINQSIYGGLAPFGAFDYQPDDGFVGEDSFVYQVFGSANGAPSRYVTVKIKVVE